MKRTKLRDRLLPRYTFGEELFNMISHIVGAVFGIWVLVSCIVVSVNNSNTWGIVTSSIFGAAIILLYTMSSVYHGLKPNMGKKVMQVMDHCTIFYLIAGTYTPIVLGNMRVVSPVWAWTIFGVVWACAVFGTVFTAIDLRKYRALSMICYIGMGWCIIMAIGPMLESCDIRCFYWILAGGIAYTLGAVLYGIGSKKKYFHSVFHVFVLLGTVCHYIGIINYVL